MYMHMRWRQYVLVRILSRRYIQTHAVRTGLPTHTGENAPPCTFKPNYINKRAALRRHRHKTVGGGHTLRTNHRRRPAQGQRFQIKHDDYY